MSRAADALGAAVVVLLLGTVAWALPPGAVSTRFWLVCGLAAAVASMLLRDPRVGPVRPQAWLQLVGSSMLFAAIFFGANRGLDALNGARAASLDTGGSLGGFELWYALCPGLTSIALGGLARSLFLQLAIPRGPTRRIDLPRVGRLGRRRACVPDRHRPE
ncbi:MAG: hypothetical protein ABIV63_02865 [Caldimonas sp.]